jgi:thiamine pyrophosphate-dependent acetolactate synthase large subunit-like protein
MLKCGQMVAMSMADGYARYTGKPQCVLIHVDVGTQGLGAAVHNASCGRAPVLIFAGLSPYTIDGEYRGSRTEYIHWIQDVPDQKQIVAQYCRYTGEIKRGANVKQMVNRALQFATSDPTGPVYLYGAREAMEEDIEEYSLVQENWLGVSAAALPEQAAADIAKLLVEAKEPLAIVGFTGRKASSVEALVKLADTVPGLKVVDTGGSDMCFPANHPASLGLKYVGEKSILTADFILVVDCDVPWIPTQCKPKPETKVVHIDVDPLKQQMPVFYIQASARYKADSTTAFNQINAYLSSNKEMNAKLQSESYKAAAEKRRASHQQRVENIRTLAELPTDHKAGLNIHIISSQIRAAVPEDTIFAVEAVTNAGFVSDQIAPVLPKTWINCGGGGLGWSGGGALGIKLATDYDHRDQASGDKIGTNKGKFVCQIVGDGTYLFSVPGSVYWIAQKYEIAVLVIVLNNKGWNAPRKSMLLVHPDGEGSRVDNKALNISFDPTPDYAGIARAASGGKVWAGCASNVEELLRLLKEAVEVVKGGTTAVLEVKIQDGELPVKATNGENGAADGGKSGS